MGRFFNIYLCIYPTRVCTHPHAVAWNSSASMRLPYVYSAQNKIFKHPSVLYASDSYVPSSSTTWPIQLQWHHTGPFYNLTYAAAITLYKDTFTIWPMQLSWHNTGPFYNLTNAAAMTSYRPLLQPDLCNCHAIIRAPFTTRSMQRPWHHTGPFYNATAMILLRCIL